MGGVILLIRCRTLETYLSKIENEKNPNQKLNIAVEASKIADKIINMTPDASEECIRNLEHFSLAVFIDNLSWAHESLENIRSDVI